jgi:transposase-like protein
MCRWGSNELCPHCEHNKIYKFTDGRRFKCASCKKQFTVKTESIFADSNISLKDWLIAYYLLANHKKGISSHQLARDLGVTQKTAWFMLQRIRSGMNDGIFKLPIGSNDGIVEIDETFVGGKNKNRHWDKKVANSQGRSFKDKTPVLGMLERGGKIRVAKVKDTTRQSVQPLIKKNVVFGSKVMTDEWWAYRTLYHLYDHSFINHGIKQYADGDVHTNTIEGFWSLFKRSIKGIYHSVSAKYLQLYAGENAFRYNTRNMSHSSRMFLLLHNANGKMSHKNLIAYAA